jgi:hypothetical protein
MYEDDPGAGRSATAGMPHDPPVTVSCTLIAVPGSPLPGLIVTLAAGGTTRLPGGRSVMGPEARSRPQRAQPR